MKAKKNRFIVFDGIDGSGKDTIIRIMSERIPDVFMSKEPTDGPVGKFLRTILSGSDPISSDAEIMCSLFTIDRVWHSKNVVYPALKDGKTVISSRGIGSTIAYQSVSYSHGSKSVDADLFRMGIERDMLMHHSIVIPDLVILMDIDVDTAMDRISGRENREVFEKRSFLSDVRDAYLQWVKRSCMNIAIVDATKTVDELSDECIDLISKQVK